MRARAALLVVLTAVLAAGAAAAVVTQGAVPRGVGGVAVADAWIDVSHGGVELTAGPGVEGFSAGDLATAAVLADLRDYWSQTLPAEFHTSFRPLAGGYVAVNTSAPGGRVLCLADPAVVAGNAYYCPQQDGIAFDSSALVPVLLGHYGAAGLVASFAHEFGHAIQQRIGPTAAEQSADPTAYPPVLIESQADCYAGAFLAWEVAGHGTRVHLTASAMVRAVAPLVDFRDPVTVDPDDPTAHGLGLDRLDHVLVGYRGGPTACHAMTPATLDLTLGRAGTTPGGATPRFADDSEALAAARRSVAAFFGSAIGPSAADLAVARPFGQFAEAAATAWSTALDRGPGAPALRGAQREDVAAACLTGSWTASVFGHAAPGELGSWTGDADEALDFLRSLPGATFAELTGFSAGFHQGRSACG